MCPRCKNYMIFYGADQEISRFCSLAQPQPASSPLWSMASPNAECSILYKKLPRVIHPSHALKSLFSSQLADASAALVPMPWKYSRESGQAESVCGSRKYS